MPKTIVAPIRSIAWLAGRLSTRLEPQAYQWFRLQLQLLSSSADDMVFFRALGLVPRRVGKTDLALSAAELADAHQLRSGFNPGNWSTDQAVRVAFILSRYLQQPDRFPARIEQLAEGAELNELIALYLGFALYPLSALLEPRAREAIRSSMRPVFESLAQHNPYPVENFDQAAWNQMVVKTFFLDTALWPIQGIDHRHNRDLCNILLDLAQERQAAGRSIGAELWRCVAPFSDAPRVGAALQAVLAHGRLAERVAIHWSLPAGSSLHALCDAQELGKKSAGLDWTTLHLL